MLQSPATLRDRQPQVRDKKYRTNKEDDKISEEAEAQLIFHSCFCSIM